MKRDMYIEKGKIDKDSLFLSCKFSKDAVTFQQCIEAIINRVNEAEDEKDNALEKVKEWNKDEELEKMRSELKVAQEDKWRGFPISKEEDASITKWCKKHEIEKHGLVTEKLRLKSQGCCGGKYVYEFIPTSIGTIGRIKCSCGDEFTFCGL